MWWFSFLLKKQQKLIREGGKKILVMFRV